jgi:predicted  nucleic acid-binding Zn-ribbon protein
MDSVGVSLLLLTAPLAVVSAAQESGATRNPEQEAMVRVACSRLESLQIEVDGLAVSLAGADVDRREIDSRIRAWRRRARELEIRVHGFAAKRETDWLEFERRVNQELDRLDSELAELQTEKTRGNLGRSRVTTVWPGEDAGVFIEDLRSVVQ